MKEQPEKQSSSVFNVQGGKSRSNSIEVPSVTLPRGGGAIKGIDEKFSVNAANGTAAFSIPLPVSTARGAAPELSLSYNSGAGNSIFGQGWSVNLPSIKRKINQELPRYIDTVESDTFLFAETEDLVPEFQKEPGGGFSQDGDGNYVYRERTSGDFTVRFYRPRTEGLFARIERWTHNTTRETKWRVTSKDNVTTLFGWSAASRIADPANVHNVFEWLPEFVFDDRGNCSRYSYKQEDDAGFDTALIHNKNRRKDGNLTYTNRYVEKVFYGNKAPYAQFGDPFPATNTFMYETVFDYGEYDTAPPYQVVQDWVFRPDAFSDYRAGFEIRTTRLCQRILLIHHFTELPGGSAVVKSLDFVYDMAVEQGFTFLTSVTSRGYIKQPGGTYTSKQLPPMEFTYQRHEWNKEVKNLAPEDVVHAPAGLDEPGYQFTDLLSEGLSGILTEQAEGWYYKRNLGGGQFARAEQVTPKPSFTGLGKKLRLTDLDGDGNKQLVSLNDQPKGYFELNGDEAWQPFKSFKHLPNIDFKDSHTRLIDLTGDGKPDVLITKDEIFTWYESTGREGFGQAQNTPKPFDEETGPTIVFADGEQSIFLADMSGDGLSDIVRIRHSEVVYWPNLGYGKFGAKVIMDNAPVFDSPEAFNPSRLRLADIDGSGTDDIIYLGQGTCRCWLNLSGNALAGTSFDIEAFPEVHEETDVTVVDLLGTGTACIVWSSALPKDVNTPLRYIDLMDSKKPHIMIGYKNNLGKEVSLSYTPSTHFYLEDEKAGRPWVTKLHFPVQCISKSETVDKITGHRFISTYSYHHGYYDHPEREFRGFGLVEQTDAEHFEHWVKSGASNIVAEDLHQEPVVRKQWFHTGAFLGKDKILTQFADDYWYEEMARQGFSVAPNEHELDDARLITAPGLDPSIIDNLSGEEWQQALRACKSMPLRTETFAHDAPLSGATPAQLQRQLTPYSVSAHNCTIELLQPKGHNKYAVFLVKEGEKITYDYERDTSDPRIAHELNTAFDEYGNVLESAKVAYPRKITDATLPVATQGAQGQTIITYTRQQFTNDVLSNDTYRLRLPSEEQTFELRGVAKAGDYYVPADFTNILTLATDVLYHQKHNNPLPGSPEKRLTEHTRSVYYKNDLSGALPLHQLESRALPFENYQLAYTPSLLTDIFAAKVTDPALTEGKFIHSQGDTNWWVRSGTAQFKTAGESVTDALDRFFVPISYTDPYGAVTTVAYTGFFTFIKSTEDALGNTNTVDVFSFRTLQPQRLKDANDNLTETITDELGLVKAVAVMGKGSEADDLTGLNEFTSAAESADSANFFSSGNATTLTTRGKSLLQHASMRMVYDLDAYQTSGKPVVAATITREEYFQQMPDSPVQLSFEYSGGLGQVVMKKTQAEPGLAKQVTVAPDDSITITEVDTSPHLRWVGDGRTVVNNKGNPVKQYEPYFSVTHQFEDTQELVESGVTSVLYYDALDRLIKTVYPNGTLSKTEYGTWQQAESDPGDTVLESSWHETRANSLIDAELLAEGKDPLREKQAAIASANYAGTPKVQHFDPLKRPVLLIDHNKQSPPATDEFYHTAATLDAEGNLLSLTDARGNTVMQHKYDMLGNLVYQNGMDNGQRWMLHSVTNNPLRTWDERNYEFQYSYDALERPLQTKLLGGDGPAPLNNIVERTFYGEAETNPKLKNLRGQPVSRYDTGGLLETSEYDFKQQPLTSTRTLFAKYKETANWTDANLVADLEPENFTATTVYDALGRIKQQTTPDGSVTATAYNQAGLLNGKTITHSDSTLETLITNVDYNEKGQRTTIVYGNNATTTFMYDKQTFRLQRLVSQKQNGDALQDLHYTYDAVGNATHVEDKAIPVTFFDNNMITGLSTYTYDSLYRLTEATGRENNAALAFAGNDNWNDADFMGQLHVSDPLALRNYAQSYQYDAVGNITQMHHQASGNNWTRNYTYASGNNRLQSTALGGNTYTYTHHPQHGFMTTMPHLADMVWSFKEELIRTARQSVASGTPETTYYQYDAQGQRLRKITENAAGTGETPDIKEERVYLTGYEFYKKHGGTNAGLERHTVQATDEDHCFAMIETRNNVDDGTEQRLTRYQLHNHLGSTNLELDEHAQVITYEEYHPYGTTAYQLQNADVRGAAKRYRFLGLERDEESGLSYHNARYYVPWLARWLSPDPLGIQEGTNFYLYALANPYFYKDTSGMDLTDPNPGDFESFEEFWNAFEYPASEEYARSVWQQAGEEIVTEQTEEYEEEYTEWVEEEYEVQQASGAALVAGAALTGIGTDVAIPEPTDVVVWPKWIVYGVVAAAAGVTLAVSTTTTTTMTRRVPRTRTRRRTRRAPLTYITYTLSNPVTGEIYVGRSMGYGTPQQIMMARYATHHMRALGFGNPQLDRALPATRSFGRRHTDPAYQAIRGREQLVIDAFGGSWSTVGRGNTRSGNAIRGVGLTNRRRATYMLAGSIFGPVSTAEILLKHPLAALVPWP